MTTNQPPDSMDEPSQTTDPLQGSKSVPQNASGGSFEGGYKPNWLDIGPLPDDAVLAPVAGGIDPQDRDDGEKSRYRPPKRRDRISSILIIIGLLLLAAAAIINFLNPFIRVALGQASLARPVASPETALPRVGSGNWCLVGDFLNGEAPRLLDSGEGGDILAEDRVYTLDYTIPLIGSYDWQVIDCENPALSFPQAPAWLTTTEPDQQVTFIFDSDERDDPLFFPIPYVVNALDSAANFKVVGSFQDWDATDPSGLLEPTTSGIYQQVRRIARSGIYEAYVITGEGNQAIDAYGRTTEPIPFTFQTNRNGEVVVFLVDTDRGRASVIYDIPPFITLLAFGYGYRSLSLALASLGLAIFAGLVLRLLLVRNPRLQMETGCPQCGEHELMRISRRPGDRLMHLIGVPAYRYRCRHCTWEGIRLSEKGTAYSPSADAVHLDRR
jgi:hypothetical protein